MLITPNLPDLKYKAIKGVKYFELVAEEVEREILPGLFIEVCLQLLFINKSIY